ncbi:amidase domain-containing protein [Cohnella herbarum]|uniref:Amidase domain-containing protein n=1 Tax=Cohnella herbarum TaxID=2728023 RepID=A0A7Z2VGW2_9BACL|nr:amidase domain-containing protein [Cohnella herbarum]QJD82968.1 amidase domain-containing protein [Cohnella herbarum]
MQRIMAVIVAIGFVLNTYGVVDAAAQSKSNTELEIVNFLQQLFDARSRFLLSNDNEMLNRYYLSMEKASRHALQQEMIRKEYIQAWATRRKVRFERVHSHIRVPRIRIDGNRAKVSVVLSQKLEYSYSEPFSVFQSFGIGTRHALTLIQTDGKWHVLREWYSDPLNENPRLISATNDNFPNPLIQEHTKRNRSNEGKLGYQRDRAIAYANKYAGAAWGAGNNNRYNLNYRDYTSDGGDCTNYASQVIGDPHEGGGLRMTTNWRYWFRSGGSHTWIQTDRFRKFLLASGYVSVISAGTFEEITKPSPQRPYGDIGELKPGDLIAYILHGDDVDHFGVLVGYDDNGYPLVNSHTADRIGVPFDLGWDQHTRYQLIHILD